MALQRQREIAKGDARLVSLTSLPRGLLGAEIFEESSHFGVVRNAIRE